MKPTKPQLLALKEIVQRQKGWSAAGITYKASMAKRLVEKGLAEYAVPVFGSLGLCTMQSKSRLKLTSIRPTAIGQSYAEGNM